MKPSLAFIVSVFSFILSLVATSCSNDNIDVLDEEIIYEKMPSMTVKSLNTVYNDSGRVTMVMKAPIMENFDEESPSYSIFKEGISVVYYEGSDEPSATIDADYAKFIDSESLWELRGSVKVYSNNGTTLETEQLFLDQSETDRIYTDQFVKITSADQTIMGNGFESDTKLNKRRIKKVTAIIYVTLDE